MLLCYLMAGEALVRLDDRLIPVDSRRDLRIRHTEPASSPPAGVTNLD